MSIHSRLPLVTLDVTGMHCGGCAGAVERALASVEGASEVAVNLTLNRADLRLAGDPSMAVTAVVAAGYGATIRQGTASERRQRAEVLEAVRRAEERRTFLLFVLAAILTLPFLLDMLAAWTGLTGGHLMPPVWQFALASIVQFVCGWRFIAGAASGLMRGQTSMDTLIAVGTLSAWGWSTWSTFFGGEHGAHELYFEGAATIITFVLLGKVLEANARAGATEALTALSREQPAAAQVQRNGDWVTVAAENVVSGERVLIRAGEASPVDGRVIEGTSAMSEALVTGESLPVAKAEGDRVIAGALNGQGMLVVEATAVGEDTTLARMARLVEAAQVSKAPAQKLADSVARVFVPAVFAIALLTFAVWWWLGQPDTAIRAGIAVLVISCPCALGLATPIALVAGSGLAARSGIVVRDIAALEAAASIDTVAFDKTGTLTLGQPRLLGVAAPGIGRDEALKLAAALSAGSAHPLAKAVLAAADDSDLVLPAATRIVDQPGGGVSGQINGVSAFFGSAAFLRAQGLQLGVLEQVIQRDQSFAGAQSVSWLAGAGKVIGALAFADSLRPAAPEAVAALTRAGLSVVMLSGDRQVAADAIGQAAGVTDIRAGLSPEAKLAELRRWQAEGRKVAMVGDGVNDTPALSGADLGIAMGSGTDVARASAGLTLMRPDLRLVPLAIRIARATRATIRQNLVLAFAFNIIGIPLAASGWLSTTVAGAAMAASSVSVVLNALRLSRLPVARESIRT